VPGAGHAERWSLEVLASLLGAGDGPLERVLVEENGLAERVEMHMWTFGAWGVIAVRALAPSPNAKALVEALDGALELLVRSPPSAGQLEQARDRTMLARAEALALPSSAARLAARETLLMGGVDLAAGKKISKVSAKDLAGLVETYLAGTDPAVWIVAP
jgi:predicted Zn-dependent peptidase